jgi:hypothetical protein
MSGIHKKQIVVVSLLIAGGLFLCALIFTQHSESPPAQRPESTSETSAATDPKSQDDNTAPQSTSVSVADTPLPQAPSSITKTTRITQKPDGSTFTTESGETYPLRTYKTLATNDPYGTQWWTTNSGLPSAWSIGPGTYTPTVAIIDTGISLNHEEFAGRWAVNTGEQGETIQQAESTLNCTERGIPLTMACNLIDDDYDGIVDNESGPTSSENPSRLNCTDRGVPLDKSCNLIDDDANGYTDDVTGWDFSNFDSSVQAGQTNPNGGGTTHATEVAGVLAATGNNNKGIAGVNWSAKILPLQALDDNSYGNTLSVARAVYYAVNRDVDIITISLGSESEDPYLRQAIHYALDRGVFVVAASGNNDCNCIAYPARYPEVFAVGSHKQNGSPSSFSNYGASLDVLAPGENIITTTWSSSNASGYVGGVAGTSFAAPYVTGLLSLMLSQQPSASWGELSAALLATTSHPSLSNSNPWSAQLGSGITKADAAMQRVTTPATPTVRYNLSTGSRGVQGTLASSRVYDCYGTGDYPTSLFYRIANSSSVYYTVDTLDAVRASTAGYTVSNLGRLCVGLPGDSPSFYRTINSPREFDNFDK